MRNLIFSNLSFIPNLSTYAIKNCKRTALKYSTTNRPISRSKRLCRSYTNATSMTQPCSGPFESVQLDYDYLCNEKNTAIIKDNITKRKSNGDIDKVISLYKTLQSCCLSSTQREALLNQLMKEALKIPNKSSPHLIEYGDEPFLIKKCNDVPNFDFKPLEFHDLAKRLHLIKMDHIVSQMTGPRSYVLNACLADLERAVIRYTISFLIKKGFTLLSVPDLLDDHVFKKCGMQTRGNRSQVFHLENLEGDVCLSGTSEMALGGYLQDKIYNINQLPLKLAALSRCYREELGSVSSERGVFRVNQFNKVEMFGVTANESGEESSKLYQEFIDIQIELYSKLGIHFQVLDMPVSDLGDPAYTKTDIESWIPVQKIYGEISSSSNCLDYQSRRLNLRYKTPTGNLQFVHTINGTACATPRLLISLVASNQQKNNEILIPEALQPFMNGLQAISKKQRSRGYVINHFKPKTFPGTILRPEEIEGDL